MTVRTQPQPRFIVDTEDERSTSWPDGSTIFVKATQSHYILIDGGFILLSSVAGSGTVNSGAANRLAYYSALGTAVDDLAAITASRALVSDGSGLPTASSVTSTTLAFLDATSSVQTQLNAKAATNLSNVASVSVDVPMNSHKLTGLAAGTSNGDSVRYEQLPGVAGTITVWVSYTPTMGGFDTLTSSVWWKRNGDTLTVQGWGTSPTFSATNLSITLPGALAIDSAKIGTTSGRQLVGLGSIAQSGGTTDIIRIFFDGSDTAKVYFGNGAGGTTEFSKRTASSFFGAGTPTTAAFRFELPISGWSI